MKRSFAVPLVVALALMAYIPAAFAASTFYVNDNNCPGPGTGTKVDPFCTISEAVTAAASGDTIIVRAGDYRETVSVTKSLTFRGAQAGVTAVKGRTKASKESTVDNPSGTGGFDLKADNVTINGFTIEGQFDTAPTSLASGIRTSNVHSGYHIMNNIIRDNVAGLYLNTNTANPNSVTGNRFHANNEAGSGSGDAIESDQGLHNVTISKNFFSGNASAAVVLSDSLPFTNDGIQFLKNRSDSPVLLYNTSASSVFKNTFARDVGSAVFLGGGDSNVTITKNAIHTPVFAGVRLADSPTIPNTSITISRNAISGAGFYGIHIGTSSLSGGTIARNTVTGSDPEGILTETGNTGNTFSNNTVTKSKSFDIEDDSTGNTYTNNTCGSSSPSGLCS